MNRALGFNAGGVVGEFPGSQKRRGHGLGLYLKKCLDYIPALVGPHPISPLPGLYFARLNSVLLLVRV